MFKIRKLSESDATEQFHREIGKKSVKKSKRSALNQSLKDIETIQKSDVIDAIRLGPKYRFALFFLNLISFFGFLIWYLVSEKYIHYWREGGWLMAFFPLVCVLFYTGSISYASIGLKELKLEKQN